MSNIKTPLEVIQEGEREFRANWGRFYIDDGNKDWEKGDKNCVASDSMEDESKSQTLALLQALHDELDGKQRKVWTEKEFQMLDMVGMQKASTDVSYNQAIQDQQDNLQALMDSIRA